MIGGSIAGARLLVGMLIAAAATAAMLIAVSPGQASGIGGFSAAELIDGFHKTVFGLEYGPSNFARIVKKYRAPVRLRVINRSRIDRHDDVARFVSNLNRRIPGLDIAMSGSDRAANFTVYVVDRADYASVVRAGIIGTHGAVPGQCVVRIEPGSGGIRQSTAVIVSDEGDSLFQRCMVEEILQGLGPINDDASLVHSVFNDRSRHCRFMPFDRAIVAMLYDRRIRNGMERSDVDAILPKIVADLSARLE